MGGGWGWGGEEQSRYLARDPRPKAQGSHCLDATVRCSLRTEHDGLHKDCQEGKKIYGKNRGATVSRLFHPSRFVAPSFVAPLSFVHLARFPAKPGRSFTLVSVLEFCAPAGSPGPVAGRAVKRCGGRATARPTERPYDKPHVQPTPTYVTVFVFFVAALAYIGMSCMHPCRHACAYPPPAIAIC